MRAYLFTFATVLVCSVAALGLPFQPLSSLPDELKAPDISRIASNGNNTIREALQFAQPGLTDTSGPQKSFGISRREDALF